MTTQLAGPVVLNDTEFGSPSVPSFVDDISVPLTASYPAGGYNTLNALLQKQTGDQRQIMEVLTGIDLSGYQIVWDAANSALRLFVGASGAVSAEVATNTDLHLITLRIRVLSK